MRLLEKFDFRVADDVDFLSTNKTMYTEKLGLIGEILHSHNLLVNADKTENSVLKRSILLGLYDPMETNPMVEELLTL